MSWQALLQSKDEDKTLPWTGGRKLHDAERSWRIIGALPDEHGWHDFRLQGRRAHWRGEAMSTPEVLSRRKQGYLVGDRLVPDGVGFEADMRRFARSFERVHLIEAGLDRFTRISAGRVYAHGPLIFESQAFPLGPEDEVLAAFLDKKESVDHVNGVAPALAGAFAVQTWQRDEAERRRRQARERREAAERARLLQQRRQQLREQLGDGALRRQLAQIDFAEAAEAALAVGGAEYLDHRWAPNRREIVVVFRQARGRYECTCDPDTLRIIDAGICLIDHDTDERGDSYFTLESLPGVITQAEREGRLVVFRRA